MRSWRGDPAHVRCRPVSIGGYGLGGSREARSRSCPGTGLGKSLIGVDMAARVTTGHDWPDGAAGASRAAW